MSAHGYTVAAFHTPEYAETVPGFVTLCRKAGLAYEIEPMESRFDHAENTGLKPLALMRIRDRVAGPLLYLDIDTAILGAPPLPAGEWDIATAQNPVAAHRNRINAAAFFLSDTPAARYFLQRWATLVRYNPGTVDHTQLTRALMELAGMCGPSVPVAHTSPDRQKWLETLAASARGELTVAAADFSGCLAINGLRPERTQAKS
jgi:hypothetical protein